MGPSGLWKLGTSGLESVEDAQQRERSPSAGFKLRAGVVEVRMAVGVGQKVWDSFLEYLPLPHQARE